MICEHCGTVFCRDEADSVFLGASPAHYCSRACKKNAAKKRRERRKTQDLRRDQVRLQMCREHPKAEYATEKAALLAIAQLRRIPPLYPYECPCGCWHLTSLSRAASY